MALEGTIRDFGLPDIFQLIGLQRKTGILTLTNEKDGETVTASCPVPIVMAGGKKLPELEALTMAYNAVQQGAAGVDMGRNIFQSDAPKAMLAAVTAVVHQNETPEKALDLFSTLKREHAARGC